MISPAQFIDHTLLNPEATEADVGCLCEEAVEYGFASVCIPPRDVAFAAKALYGSEVAVGTVVGFPLGYESPAVKAFQTATAVSAGAREIDMVIDLGAARAERFDLVQADIEKVVAAAEGRPVKVIIECCLFSAALKQRLTEVVVVSRAAYVKTSTGFAAQGATLDDVALLVKSAAGRIAVKAAGGIRDWPACEAMLAAGAGRIGTSNGVAIVEQWQQQQGLG